MNLIKNFLKSFIVIFVSFSIGILLCEIILRVKHNFLINYSRPKQRSDITKGKN